MDKVIGIIPARSGSKGLPRKNGRILIDKPLMAWTIAAALESFVFDRVIVSTDDKEMADIASRYGAECPVLRPCELALDDTPLTPVLQHVVTWLEYHKKYTPGIIVLLQPTSPLRRPEHIQEAVRLLKEMKADSVVSVCLAEHSPYWMKRLEETRVYPFLKNTTEYFRRQDLPPVYRLNGAVYVTRYDILMKQNRILGEDTRAIVMDAESSIDVDTPFDFKMAELLLKERSIEGA